MTNTRDTMNGKPVLSIPAKGIINFKSGFEKKLLCDGPTFNLGYACAYSCAFCYVPSMPFGPAKKALADAGMKHEDAVVRKTGAMDAMRSQLLDTKGKPRFPDPADQRVIYSSTTVDVAANMELVRETVEACAMILELTNWHIRLLSKSNLLPKVAEALDLRFPMGAARRRMIFGVSTGTLDDKLAQAFEEGAPLVSKRIKSIHKLQDEGWRTFAMICPSLPQKDYDDFANEMNSALRTLRMEHVWAEVINVRGESLTKTYLRLKNAGYDREADALNEVSQDKAAWEHYARDTYLGHVNASHIAIPLRFLQYVNADNAAFWTPNGEARPGVVAL